MSTVKERVDTIVCGKYVMTLNPYDFVIPRGAIAIKDGLIVDVGDEYSIKDRYVAEDVVERKHHVVMPGLLDCHVHTQQLLLRSALGDVLMQMPPVWTKILVPFEEAMSEDLARLSTQASILNMLKNGVTYFVEAGAPYPEILVEEAIKSGIKGVVTYATYDVVEGETRRTSEVMERALMLYEGFSKASSRVRIWMSLRQVMMSSEELVRSVMEECRKHGIGLTLHLAEYQGEVDYTLSKYGMRPLEYMVYRGIGEIKPVIVAHGIYLSPVEISLLKKHGIGLCWCPTVDSWLMGIHWTGLLDDEDLIAGIGSDGGAWNRLDVLHEIKVARAIGKAVANSLFYYKSGTSARRLLKMATGHGGALVGERVGVIGKGYPADLAVLNVSSIKTMPVIDPVDAVVSYLEGDAVTDVLVDGVFVVKNGNVITVDEERVLKELLDREDQVREVVHELFKKLPISPPS
ncbi:MAG: amidohydrolase family protein [Desulfurococcaceae archaeon]